MKIKSDQIKKYSKIILGFTIVASFLIVGYVNKSNAAPDSTVYLNPASITINTGESFNLSAKINPGSNQVSAVELHIVFNPDLVNIVNITRNAESFPDELISSQINNDTGTASISLGSGSSTYVSSETAIAEISFRALAQGTSSISLAGTKAAGKGEGSTSVVSSLSNTQVVINAFVKTYNNSDFANLATDWLQSKESVADVNADSIINAQDLGIMMHNWEK